MSYAGRLALDHRATVSQSGALADLRMTTSAPAQVQPPSDGMATASAMRKPRDALRKQAGGRCGCNGTGSVVTESSRGRVSP